MFLKTLVTSPNILPSLCHYDVCVGGNNIITSSFSYAYYYGMTLTHGATLEQAAIIANDVYKRMAFELSDSVDKALKFEPWNLIALRFGAETIDDALKFTNICQVLSFQARSMEESLPYKSTDCSYNSEDHCYHMIIDNNIDSIICETYN